MSDFDLSKATAVLDSEISDATSLRDIADIALTAKDKQAGWGRVRLLALRKLGKFLIRKGA